MKIACTTNDVAAQVVDVLRRLGITRGVYWEGGSPIDEQIWVFVNVDIEPAVKAAIQRDSEAIAGATFEE